MLLLNSKRILECDESDVELHEKEICKIIEQIKEIGNYECAVVMKYQDPANKNRESKIFSCNLNSIEEIVEFCDFKNGIDIYLDEEYYYVFLVYGQFYQLDNKYNVVTTALKIMPYDSNKNFISVKGFG